MFTLILFFTNDAIVQFSINVCPTRWRLARKKTDDFLPNQIFLLFLQSSTISITQTNWFYFVEAKAMFNVRYTLSIHSSRYKMLPCFNRVIVCDYLILLSVQYFLCCKVTTHWPLTLKKTTADLFCQDLRPTQTFKLKSYGSTANTHFHSCRIFRLWRQKGVDSTQKMRHKPSKQFLLSATN